MWLTTTYFSISDFFRACGGCLSATRRRGRPQSRTLWMSSKNKQWHVTDVRHCCHFRKQGQGHYLDEMCSALCAFGSDAVWTALFFCVRVHVQCKGRGRHMNVLPPCCVSKILTACVCAPTSEFDLEYC